MKIERLWQELEEEARGGSSAAWLVRYALPQFTQPFVVALETAASRRALLIPLPKEAIPVRRDWPRCRGVKIIRVVLDDQLYFGARLRDSKCTDVFSALAEDVLPRVAVSPTPKAAASAFLGRLRRWQKFLVADKEGLSLEQQRGLYGELHLLRGHLLPGLGRLAIDGWNGPRKSHQDFQFPKGSVEVKAIIAKQPQAVRITSERQLDSTGIPALYLHVVVLDERDVESTVVVAGETLPGIVGNLRQVLEGEQVLLENFEDRLLEAGYLETDVPRYENRRFTLRREFTFRVRKGFPRLVESDLSPGIGDVSYSLSLAACEPFSEDIGNMIAVLQIPVVRKSKRLR